MKFRSIGSGGGTTLDAKIESKTDYVAQVGDQTQSLVSASSFTVGNQLLLTAECAMKSEVNALSSVIVRIEMTGASGPGLSVPKTIGFPATGAGDFFDNHLLALSTIVTVDVAGTKTFRLMINTASLGPGGTFTVWNMRIWKL